MQDPDPAPDLYLSCICVPTHYCWSIQFSAVNSVFSFLTFFSHVCQIYVAEVLIKHFYNDYQLRFLITM